MKLLLLVLVASCTAQDMPNWSGACMAKMTGPASPANVVKTPSFIQDVSNTCQAKPTDDKEYTHCYNQIVYCSNESCTLNFTLK